jgi:golgin subfamily B member 1
METFTFADLTQSQGDFSTDKATMNTSNETSPNPMPSQVHLVPRHITFTSGDESSMMHDANKLRIELDQITKEKNDAVEALKAELTAKADEMANMQLDLAAKTKLYEDLNAEKQEVEKELDDVRVSMMKFSAYETTLRKKDEDISNSLLKIQQLEMELKSQNHELENLKIVMNEKDENIQKLSEDLSISQTKCKENEKMLNDLERLKLQVTSYNDVMAEKENLLKKLELDLMKYVKSDRELLEKAENCDKLLDANQQLESDVDNLKRELSLKSFALEKCKFDLQEMEQKVDSLKKDDEVIDMRNISVEEISAKLERELNYSAELDGNIAKAIESESEVNSELEELGGKRPSRYQEKMKKLEEELDSLKKQYQKINAELDDEKKNSDSIQMQDASLIEAIKIRLEAALDNENVLKRMLEAERHKTDSLSSQLTGIQRTKSFDNYLLFNKSSMPDSPRRLAKLNEFESEVVSRLESEIKLLSSQNERERDRVVDLQKVLDRERDRFSKALVDQQEYSEQMKKEVKRLVNDKEQLENELDQLHDLKMKYFELEREKDKLMETIRALRNDIDRGTKRETKLAEALLKESDESVPEQFMQKLKEINKSLADNVRENHQLAETLHVLTEERRALQQKIAELENNGNLMHYKSNNNQDLEERANHLFAKYMRCESFRKGLIYQKKFLLITIASTIGFGNVPMPLFKADPKKRKSLR